MAHHPGKFGLYRSVGVATKKPQRGDITVERDRTA